MATATTPLLGGTYNADPVHSSFGFAVRYQGVSLFKGTLDEVAATLTDGRLEGTAKVESISIRTPEQFRQHVLSAEFFDAANHPEVTFASDDARPARGRHRDASPASSRSRASRARSRRPARGPRPPPTPSATPAATSTSRPSSTAPSGT